MLFTVVPTHVQGKRRAKAAMADAERVCGHLLIQDWKTGSAGRPLLAAYLKDLRGTFEHDTIQPIFDVKVVRITVSGMHLVGYEIKSEGGVAIEYVQGWWAKLGEGV
jgi:hypothetical protein